LKADRGSQNSSQFHRLGTAITRRRPAAVACLATFLLVVAALQPLQASASLLGLPTSNVILTGPGIPASAGLASGAGGQVLTDLPLINGVLASVPTAALSVLDAVPGLVVTPDVPVSVAGQYATAPTRSPAAVFPEQTGATQLAASGITGQGVAVAVLDTGIDPLPDFAGRLIDGVDLSGGGNPFQDDYGHGTFIAGLIAGNGASSGGQYIGEAPGANLVSVKVAGASGTTDMATVILGVGWVVAHQAVDHIGVLNMSLGAVPTSSTVLNPLDRAVEAAWRSGVAVVVSAGNAGPFNGTIMSPGDDPLVVTAGALDDQGGVTASADTMATFSSVGPTTPDGWFKPDLVTSGRSVVSLRAPGSTIDQTYPSARIGTGNFVGSGTSFAAAITSGAAALVMQANGAVFGQPNALKARLLGTATPGPVGNPFVDGHGDLNAYWAATAGPVTLTQVTPVLPALPGQTMSLVATGATSAWNSANWSASTWNGSTWNGSTWNASTWNGSTWNGSTWNASTWNGSTWNGSTWNASTWNGSTWNGSTWNASTWNGSSWNASTWNGSTWNGSTWNASTWNASTWN
jgi:serine protease AprX